MSKCKVRSLPTCNAGLAALMVGNATLVACGGSGGPSRVANFHAIRAGDDRSTVIQRMGQPDQLEIAGILGFLRAEHLIWFDGRASYAIYLAGTATSDEVVVATIYRPSSGN